MSEPSQTRRTRHGSANTATDARKNHPLTTTGPASAASEALQPSLPPGGAYHEGGMSICRSLFPGRPLNCSACLGFLGFPVIKHLIAEGWYSQNQGKFEFPPRFVLSCYAGIISFEKVHLGDFTRQKRHKKTFLAQL